MNLLFRRKVTGCDAETIRGLIKDMMECIEMWNELEEDERYEFRLILHELISNGVVHGNKSMCDKSLIAIIQEVDKRTLSICIQDEGRGYMYKDIVQGHYPADTIPYSERGRGLQLVQAMCDTIRLNYRGNQVKVKKTLKK